jgi:hypothetical protein
MRRNSTSLAYVLIAAAGLLGLPVLDGVLR